MTVAERQLEMLTGANALAESQIKAIEKAAADQIKSLDAQWKAAQDSASAMRGVDLSVQSVASAIAGLNAALTALGIGRASTSTATGVAGSLPTTSTAIPASSGAGSSINPVVDSVAGLTSAQLRYYSAIAGKPGQGTASEILRYVSGLQDVQALASYESVSGIAHASNESADSIMARYGYKLLDPSSSDPKTRYSQLPGFDLGINRVPYDMPAMIHEDEAVIPARFNPFNPGAQSPLSGGNGKLESLVEALTRQNGRLEKRLESIESNTRRSHDLMDRVTEGGNANRVKVVETV
jgi:hypothetical protein